MAITWTNKDGDVIKVSHEGLVLKARKCECVRVMSDIYSDEFYAVVWDSEKGDTVDVHIGSCFELFDGPWGMAVEDATPEVKEAYLGMLIEKQRRRDEQVSREAEEARRREWNRPRHGMRMRVVKGRKVPQGTEGIVFWVRDGRVGLALDESRDAKGRYANVAWVDGSYLENTAPFDAAA